jgi:hypothetical protein
MSKTLAKRALDYDWEKVLTDQERKTFQENMKQMPLHVLISYASIIFKMQLCASRQSQSKTRKE